MPTAMHRPSSASSPVSAGPALVGRGQPPSSARRRLPLAVDAPCVVPAGLVRLPRTRVLGTMETMHDALAVLISTLDDLGVAYEASEQTVVAELPGAHKLKTPVAFTIGEHSVAINAFVVRAPQEHVAQVHHWLLRRNQRLFAVAYAVDHLGDIYLVGRLPGAAITAEGVDAILGSIASTADGDFNTLLEMGFEEAIRAEWRWRLDRGEPTFNLEAFRHLAPE